jgi:2-(1,2-epoxy-1,2-dihydrophenyl)acetyl-CoA isomerase
MGGSVDLQVDQGLATITINRPERMNVLTDAMIVDLTDIARDLAGEPECRVIAIRHAGKNLSTGSDTGDLTDVAAQSSSARERIFYHGLATRIQPLLRAYLALPQPVVISARGHAIGLGAQFLLTADLVVASETLKITLPQVQLGHVFDHGESYLLPRRIGHRKAMELALLGDRMSAIDAERFGLINFLVSDAELETRTNDILARLMALPPLALLSSKALMRSSESADLDTQLSAERMFVSRCASSEDFTEAMNAFAEKREPRFTGR